MDKHQSFKQTFTLKSRLTLSATFKLLSIVTALSLCGCSLTSTVTSSPSDRFTLSQGIIAQAYDNTYDIEVKIPDILNQGGVVMEISDVVLRPARNYRYSNSLDTEMQLLFKDGILKAKSQYKKSWPTQYKVVIYISEFQGTVNSEAKVSAFVKVINTKNDATLFSRNFSKITDLQADGYDNLVSQLKHSFLEIVDETITSVLRIKKPKS